MSYNKTKLYIFLNVHKAVYTYIIVKSHSTHGYEF